MTKRRLTEEERNKVKEVIKNNWSLFSETFDGHQLVSRKYVAENFEFPSEFLDKVTTTEVAGSGKFALYDNDGNPVDKIDNTIYGRNILNFVANLFVHGNNDSFKKARTSLGRGSEARHLKSAIYQTLIEA